MIKQGARRTHAGQPMANASDLIGKAMQNFHGEMPVLRSILEHRLGDFTAFTRHLIRTK